MVGLTTRILHLSLSFVRTKITIKLKFSLEASCWLEIGLFRVESLNLIIFEEDKMKIAYMLQTIFSVGSRFRRFKLIIVGL